MLPALVLLDRGGAPPPTEALGKGGSPQQNIREVKRRKVEADPSVETDPFKLEVFKRHLRLVRTASAAAALMSESDLFPPLLPGELYINSIPATSYASLVQVVVTAYEPGFLHWRDEVGRDAALELHKKESERPYHTYSRIEDGHTTVSQDYVRLLLIGLLLTEAHAMIVAEDQQMELSSESAVLMIRTLGSSQPVRHSYAQALALVIAYVDELARSKARAVRDEGGEAAAEEKQEIAKQLLGTPP